MEMLALAGLAFLIIHIVPATPLRQASVSTIGEKAYMGIFSLLSLVLIVLWVRAFSAADYSDLLWSYPEWWPWLKAAIILFALILFVGSVSAPNPSSPQAGKLLERADIASGILAITRHPGMWGFGLWALAHLISQPNWRGFWFFGLFALTAIGGVWLQDRRKAQEYGESWARFRQHTSFVPFAAILQGRAKLSLSAIGWWRIAIALVLWAILLHFHLWLFSASPLPGLSG